MSTPALPPKADRRPIELGWAFVVCSKRPSSSIEPTETESLEELDAFVDAMIAIRQEAAKDPAILTNAPHTTPVSRLDEVKAVKTLDLGVHLSLARQS